jgi:hypothetical protein
MKVIAAVTMLSVFGVFLTLARWRSQHQGLNHAGGRHPSPHREQ